MDQTRGHTDRPRPADVVTQLHDVLARHPEALVAAIDRSGLFVAMPPAVPVTTQRVSTARSALDLVEPSDRLAVVEAWRLLREYGQASIAVSLGGTRRAASMTFLDVSAEYGVVIGVVVATDADAARADAAALLPAITIPPPRLASSRKDESAIVTAVDERFTAMLGWEAAEVVGRRSLELIHPDDRDRAVVLWVEALGRPGGTSRARLRHQHRDGRWVWLEIANTNLLADPERGYVDCEMIDISEEMAAHEAVRASEQLLRRLAEALPVGVVHFDVDGRVVYANDCLYDTFGARRDTEPAAILGCIVDREAVTRALQAVLAGHDADDEILIDRLDGGGRRRCTLAVRALTNDEGTVTGGVGCVADVTDAVNMRTELERRATFDTLTGCMNRAAVLSTLSSIADGAATGGRTGVAVVFIDLDGFKAVNDGFGHTVGDGLLAALGTRLRDAVRGGDVIGRLGGDEFLAVCPQVDDAATARAIADRIDAAITAPVTVDGILLVPGASIGVVWTAQAAGVDAESLVAEADAAMYAAKHAGDGRPVVAESRREARAAAVR